MFLHEDKLTLIKLMELMKIRLASLTVKGNNQIGQFTDYFCYLFVNLFLHLHRYKNAKVELVKVPKTMLHFYQNRKDKFEGN